MYIAIGHPHSDDQGISMRILHPFVVCLSENYIFKISSGTFGRTIIYPMHICLGWAPCFFCIPVAYTATIPSYMWSPKNGQDFPYLLWTSFFPGHSFLLATCGSLSRNSLKYPAWINLSILSFKVMHLSLLCPISLWKAQFVLTCLCDLSLLITSDFLYRLLSVTT